MKALLLAAGLGTRLKPITAKLPKCMVPLGGKPLLNHWFDLLTSHEVASTLEVGERIDEILINTHHLSEIVEEYVKHSSWSNRVSILHESTLLGTAGTLRVNRRRLGNSPFFLAHADNVSRFSFLEFVTCFRQRPPSCVGTMMTFETDTPQSCGIVKVNNQNLLVDYYEKPRNPTGNIANAAVFIFDSSIHDLVEELNDPKDFCADVVPHLVGKVNVFHNALYHRDIGTLASYTKAARDYDSFLRGKEL